ncbi:hypothetical protein PF005_g12762 [Phytophthora fragariae]|uniref:Uncharacterized protein n=1 Tax=Phytophthora fragariae TaxID=53985 RepID=A0A6A3JE34_9STRA|nr:hypothetical protein PF003_g39410 [Phytophthora fragariae]KAE8930625.1 hypothetical protein PF009_g19293 [Phytophthora fragariae]KAE8993536.1 hypothetical protein PF011_g17102 [Phytophthora fragariae]KAE9092850.1 hypothetical protein PF007_g18330 [Phytophthora fragariae]KAE9092925.1 hypothetical protein PF010_g17679 [Phytophthora fragariae]
MLLAPGMAFFCLGTSPTPATPASAEVTGTLPVDAASTHATIVEEKRLARPRPSAKATPGGQQPPFAETLSALTKSTASRAHRAATESNSASPCNAHEHSPREKGKQKAFVSSSTVGVVSPHPCFH